MTQENKTPEATEPILAPEEIDALMQAVVPSEEADALFATLPDVPQPKHIEDFDFEVAANNGPERYPLFSTLQQRMSEALKEIWIEIFQREILLDGENIEQRVYADIVAEDKKKPQVYFIYDVQDFGRMVVAWDLPLVIAYIDAMLGGLGEAYEADANTLSPVEMKLARRVGKSLEKLLDRMWTPVSKKQYVLQKIEVEAQFLGLASASDMCFSVPFAIDISEDLKGYVQLHYPRTFLAPILDNLRTASSDEVNPMDAAWQSSLEKGLDQVPLTARLEFGTCHLNIQQFLSLRAGDFLPLNKNEHDPAKLWVSSVSLFEAMPGSQDGLLAAELLEPISQN